MKNIIEESISPTDNKLEKVDRLMELLKRIRSDQDVQMTYYRIETSVY